MTLQTTGPISLGNVGTELGRAAGTTTSLVETAVRNLAGIAPGAITLSNLFGKSSVAFTPSGGLLSGSSVALNDWAVGLGIATVTIQCTQSAVWTWSGSGGGLDHLLASRLGDHRQQSPSALKYRLHRPAEFLDGECDRWGCHEILAG